MLCVDMFGVGNILLFGYFQQRAVHLFTLSKFPPGNGRRLADVVSTWHCFPARISSWQRDVEENPPLGTIFLEQLVPTSRLHEPRVAV